jgi:hypothetical protein
MQQQINSIIEKLEGLHKQSLDFNKSSYSMGRAKPGIANQLQAIILDLKALRSEEPTAVTTLVTSDEHGNPIEKVVASHGKQKTANTR